MKMEEGINFKKYKNNLRKKLQQAAILLGIGAVALNGCASIPSKVYKSYNFEDKPVSVKGYKTTEGIEMALRAFAGMYVGTVKVTKIDSDYAAQSIKTKSRSYTMQGFYSEVEHPEALEKVLMAVDTNADKIITEKELRNFEIEFNKRLHKKEK